MQSEWVYKEISYCAIPIDLITWQKMWGLARIVYKSEAGCRKTPGQISTVCISMYSISYMLISYMLRTTF